MSLKTRLDGRSKNNNLFQIKNNEGKIIATVKVLDNVSLTLELTTEEDLHITKPNGWSSKTRN